MLLSICSLFLYNKIYSKLLWKNRIAFSIRKQMRRLFSLIEYRNIHDLLCQANAIGMIYDSKRFCGEYSLKHIKLIGNAIFSEYTNILVKAKVDDYEIFCLIVRQISGKII